MSTPFRECPACGAHLDAGERCDCAEVAAAAERATTREAEITPHCKKCVHYEACVDWAKAIYDGKYQEVMEGEAERCGNYLEIAEAKKIYTMMIKELLGVG